MLIFALNVNFYIPLESQFIADSEYVFTHQIKLIGNFIRFVLSARKKKVKVTFYFRFAYYKNFRGNLYFFLYV